MEAKDVSGIIILSLVIIGLVGMFILITLIMVDEITEEYKYSIDIPCYDKFSNEIYGLVCEKEIRCGIIFKQKNVNNIIYSCDKSIGIIRNDSLSEDSVQ